MARSDSRARLRAFQEQLAQKLAQAKSAPVTASRLGFLVNDKRWLIDLADAGELVPVPDITAVPHTHAWYRGLMSLRGNLVSVIDFSAFTGGANTRIERESRVLSFAPQLEFNASILVTRMLGLHNIEGWSREADPVGVMHWQGAVLRDGNGETWHELGFDALARDDQFLRISPL
jgi:twitching motility protein PilI